MLPWGITVQPEGRPEQLVGQMTISGIAYGAACWAQAGYWIDEQWAGRGIVPLALAMAGDHVFGTLRLHRLEVAIRPENTNSLRVVRKLGFRYVDGVDSTAVPQNAAYFFAEADLAATARLRTTTANAVARLPKAAYLTVTIKGAAIAKVGKADVVINGEWQGAA